MLLELLDVEAGWPGVLAAGVCAICGPEFIGILLGDVRRGRSWIDGPAEAVAGEAADHLSEYEHRH
jgi:hypothetical protein